MIKKLFITLIVGAGLLFLVNTTFAGTDCTGGSISYSSGKTIHIFTTSSTLVCTGGTGSVEYLVVAGGGAANLGAGGAGGFLTATGYTVTGNVSVIVGNNGGTYTASGQDSTFGTITATGGGSQGSDNGGSGRGAWTTGTPGTGVYGQGFAGGAGATTAGGGGGGANATGTAATAGVGGKGGDGKVSTISGSSVTYAGGGGGGASTTGGAGGAGGGGAGGTVYGSDATANTGGGGGGGYADHGGLGGSGIVIVSYVTGSFVSPSTPMMQVIWLE